MAANKIGKKGGGIILIGIILLAIIGGTYAFVGSVPNFPLPLGSNQGFCYTSQNGQYYWASSQTPSVFCIGNITVTGNYSPNYGIFIYMVRQATSNSLYAPYDPSTENPYVGYSNNVQFAFPANYSNSTQVQLAEALNTITASNSIVQTLKPYWIYSTLLSANPYIAKQVALLSPVQLPSQPSSSTSTTTISTTTIPPSGCNCIQPNIIAQLLNSIASFINSLIKSL